MSGATIRVEIVVRYLPLAQLSRQTKWLRLDRFANDAGANALHADFERLISAGRREDFDVLQVGAKPPPCNPRDLRAYATQILGLAARLNLIPGDWFFATNVAHSSH